MSWKRILVGAASLWLGLVISTEAYDALASTTEAEQPSTPPSIDAIRELAELTVLEVDAIEAVTSEIRGHTGGTTAIVLVHGTVSIGVDLEQARFVEVDQERRHVVLALPSPTLRRVSIDHQRSRVLSCQRDGLWGLAMGSAKEDQVIASALVRGQAHLEAIGSHDVYAVRARHHAEAVLAQFMHGLDWTVEVHWE